MGTGRFYLVCDRLLERLEVFLCDGDRDLCFDLCFFDFRGERDELLRPILEFYNEKIQIIIK